MYKPLPTGAGLRLAILCTPPPLWPQSGRPESQGDGEDRARKEETDANMRSQGGAGSPLKHEGARSEGSGGDRGGYIHQRLVEQINKASQEGPSQVQAGTGLWRRCRQGSIGHS